MYNQENIRTIKEEEKRSYNAMKCLTKLERYATLA